MQGITITLDEYRSLLEAQFLRKEVENLLTEKLTSNLGIYADEVRLLCNLFGIEVEEE